MGSKGRRTDGRRGWGSFLDFGVVWLVRIQFSSIRILEESLQHSCSCGLANS